MSKRCLKRKSERHRRNLEETFARYIVDVYIRRLKEVLLIYLEDALKLSEDVS